MICADAAGAADAAYNKLAGTTLTSLDRLSLGWENVKISVGEATAAALSGLGLLPEAATAAQVRLTAATDQLILLQEDLARANQEVVISHGAQRLIIESLFGSVDDAIRVYGTYIDVLAEITRIFGDLSTAEQFAIDLAKARIDLANGETGAITRVAAKYEEFLTGLDNTARNTDTLVGAYGSIENAQASVSGQLEGLLGEFDNLDDALTDLVLGHTLFAQGVVITGDVLDELASTAKTAEEALAGATPTATAVNQFHRMGAAIFIYCYTSCSFK